MNFPGITIPEAVRLTGLGRMVWRRRVQRGTIRYRQAGKGSPVMLHPDDVAALTPKWQGNPVSPRPSSAAVSAEDQSTTCDSLRAGRTSSPAAAAPGATSFPSLSPSAPTAAAVNPRTEGRP